MKRKILTSLCLGLVFIATNLFAKEPIKIACIGNSITYGSRVANREANAYPFQLQAYLGNQYEVKNFGVSGRTLLSKGDLPYIKEKAFEESQAFEPDIVFIKLGTNDSKPQNWKYKDEFISDYQALIDKFRALPSQPRIILLTPVRCFLPDDTSISPQRIETGVRPMIEELAWKNNLEIINMFNVFGTTWESHLMPDQIHPSSIGAGQVAKKMYDYLTVTPNPKGKSIDKALGLQAAGRFNFHGYQGYDFDTDGVHCKVVKPSVEAEGKPWVIRARFWGHEPQTDIDLLEQGFHIAYCDVADLYGSPKAVERWNRFYKRMVKAGFNKKVVLEGMSRGGLIVYNWAARNADKVACIYADAPVMDFKSWPMGKGKSAGSAGDTQNLLTAYGFTDEAQALAWKQNPIDCARVMAKAGIPILHVVGDVDEVVPVDENTALFEKEMKALKAPITVIHKPGIGHHPHSLSNPEAIVRFILKATGRLKNPCTHAIPGNEYRAAAGWTEGSDWHTVAKDIQETLAGKQLKLLLLGNSITQGWGGTRKAITSFSGKQALDEAIGQGTWESAGISGDRTQHLLWRLRNGNYNVCKPENVVIAIGINNLLSGQDTPEEVADGIIAVTDEAYKQFPHSRIILLGLFPSGKEKQSEIRTKCDKIHDRLKDHKFAHAEYINPTAWFLDDNGMIRDGLYGGDYIHFTGEGYKVVADELGKIIK